MDGTLSSAAMSATKVSERMARAVSLRPRLLTLPHGHSLVEEAWTPLLLVSFICLLYTIIVTNIYICFFLFLILIINFSKTA